MPAAGMTTSSFAAAGHAAPDMSNREPAALSYTENSVRGRGSLIRDPQATNSVVIRRFEIADAESGGVTYVTCAEIGALGWIAYEPLTSEDQG